jgi:hypothetical protein
MRFSKFEDLQWIYSEMLDISIGIDKNLPANTLADIVYARLDPRQTLKRHYHTRPGEGYEAFFFFNGANINVLLKDGEQIEIVRREPFHVTFHDDEIHGIINNADEPVYFEVLCTPRHRDGEEVLAQQD